ncbi:MAG: phospho-sugar mutase [Clostridiales bacterium]|nr:phospho-sugar mutase [Clostridiales bacterium]
MADYNLMYNHWLRNAVKDPDLTKELNEIKGNDEEILDRFYKSLEFGTGGLRGVIGAGTNRMNVYTVAQATQGLANYLNDSFEEPTVAIGYDSRIKSQLFAETAAGVLAANNIRVYIYPELMPTPMLSYAVRRLHCASGIVITASHNPSKYNGYKCYDSKGYQMTDAAAKKTYEYIQKVDIFEDVKSMDFEDALGEDMVDYIEDWLIDEFYEKVLSRQIEKGICKKADLKVIYSPLNGTGNKPVKTILKKIGIKDLKVVLSQEKPDGTFPTCPFPNPEIKQVFEEGMKMTDEFPADIMIATDPDCDRVGIAVRNNGEYTLMSGNEVGCMLTEYVLSRKKARGELCEKPVIVKTIVTSELIRAIANDYNCEVYDLLTGFKYIGELIEKLKDQGEEDRFELGMEESYGYLSGTHVREKDAVNASMLIAEMAAYYKTQGKTLVDVMNSLYEKYGMYLNSLLNFGFEGADGMKKMSDMMDDLRNNPPKEIGGMSVIKTADYLTSTTTDTVTGNTEKIDLPQSNVLSYSLPNDNKVIIRPSGTEPKIKIYITSHASDRANAEKKTEVLAESIEKIMGIK